MKAVILAGGEGTRLRPLTWAVPKPMVPLLNRPFLEHTLLRLRGVGADHAILTLRYLSQQVQDEFGDGAAMDMALTYLEEAQPLGTAGGVKNAQPYLDKDPLFVLNGDIFNDLDLARMLAFHRREGAQATLFLTPVENPSAYGVVETDDRDRVLRFVEKPAPGETTSNWINGGIYILEPSVLDHIPRDTFYSFERGVFPRLLELGYKVCGYRARPYWLDVGTPQAYAALHRHLLLHGQGLPPASVQRGDHVWLEADCDIDPNAVIQGPVLLGRGCRLGPGAVVLGPAVLGAECALDGGAWVEGSVLWDRVRVQRRGSLKGSLVASDVTIEGRARVEEGCILGEGIVLAEGSRIAPDTVLDLVSPRRTPSSVP